MYKTIIFDFFDVIHTDTFHAWMKPHGFSREGQFAEASRLVDRGDITMQGFYEKLSSESNIPAEVIESDFNKFSRVDQGIVDFIKKLHASYKTGLLSNAEGAYLRNILTKYQLESLFDVIVISSEVQLIKPEPEVFLHILEKLKTSAEETIFIDDNEINTKAAQALGVKSLHYRNLATLETELKEIGITV